MSGLVILAVSFLDTVQINRYGRENPTPTTNVGAGSYVIVVVFKLLYKMKSASRLY